MKRRLIAAAAAVLGTVLISGVVVQTTAAAAPIDTTVTLPLFGVPLTIDITTGPGGALANVAVTSANSTVATQLKPRKVVFESSNAAGDTAKVVVKSKHGGQSVSARAGTLLEVSGPGAWSGDVFGDGIAASSVAFTIAGTDVAPDITGITASPATGITAVVGTVEHSTGDGDDESSASARVSVQFTTTKGDMSRTLTIKVKVGSDDDGDTSAKLSVSLGRIKGVAIDAGAAAGPHTWSGLLCDGTTTATIAYTVNADGSVQDVVATPATATVKTDGGKIDVRFSDNERVRIKVRLDGTLIKISVDEGIRCRDAANPTTNVSTSIPADDNHGDGKHGHDGHGHDDETTTTVV